MSKYTSAILIVLVAMIAAAGGYFIGHPSTRQTASADKTAAAAPPRERKILYWYDPMSPAQHFDKPGKSPFMDMELVPMYDTAQPAQGGVAIDPRTVQNTGVRTAKAALGTLAQRMDTVGYIRPDERKIVLVQARAAGWVEQLHAKAVNDPVRQGQLLLELYSPDMLAAQEEYLLARKSLHGQVEDKALQRAARQKLELLDISEAQIGQLEKSGQAQRRIGFYAPVNGVITELGVRQGSQVAPGMNLFALVDLSTVWVVVEVAENQGGWIAQGSTAEISVPAYPGQHYQGTVEYVSPQVSATTRTLQARIRLNNPGGLLKPGMFAHVALSNKTKREVVLVPSEAVIVTGKRSVVIVAEGEGKFHPVEVETGNDSDGRTEILSGLADGDVVVTSGQFLLDSESNLRTGLKRLEESEK